MYYLLLYFSFLLLSHFKKFTFFIRRSTSNSICSKSVDIPQNTDDNNDFNDDNSIESFSVEDNAQKCFFCRKITIKQKGRKIFCRQIKNKKTFLSNVEKYALELNDEKMLQMISVELQTEELLCYHGACNLKYFSAYQTSSKKPETDNWAKTRLFNKQARTELVNFINDEVVLNLKVFSLKFIEQCYIVFLQEIYEREKVDCPNKFTTNALRKLIEYSFKKKIQIVSIGSNLYLMSAATDIQLINDEEITNIIFIEEAKIFALKYRAHILQIQKKPLPDYIDSSVLDKGECEVPEWLDTFWKYAIGGPRMKYGTTDEIGRISSTFSEDSIYSIHRGKIKPRKHISLGMAMKSITGCRVVVDILNRFNYCISYTKVLELETSAAYSCAEKKMLCPSGIIPTSSLSSGVAWDNYDRFVDTSSGKDTLHDTVGIMYQDIPTAQELSRNLNINEPDNEHQNSNIRDNNKRRKRSYEPNEILILPSAKQSRPDFCTNSANLEGEENITIVQNEPRNLVSIQRLNLLWLLSHKLQFEGTPMWTGYIAKSIEDDSKMQKIVYLLQINDSPTDPKVVKETMRRSLAIADECGKNFFNVTYDLNMAKYALRIQAAEKEFERLFIKFGTFHIYLAYFKAIGKFINGSGLTSMLIDSQILANGSLNSFLSGKHFNRCRKIHPLLSLALQILHIDSFLQSREDELNDVKIYLQNLNSVKGTNMQISDQAFNTLLKEYHDYKKETLEGTHGKTAQVYFMYIQLIDYYLIMDYSVRTADMELYKYALKKMINVFFTMNHPNYSRYLTIYLDKLENINSTHPGLLEDSGSSMLGIKRTKKPFSRIPIDITLEQTINADAASTSGVKEITDSFSRREKWAITHSLRTSIISNLMNFVNMRQPDDITNDLKKSVTMKYQKKLDVLLDTINERMNPFSNELSKDHLYNILSGTSVSDEIYEFLSSVETTGNKQRINFLLETSIDADRFDKAISKNAIKNFAFKNKKTVKINNKVKEVSIQRDIFGRLLYTAIQNGINLEKVLSYPLTPVPFSMCHTDGNICKTPKSVILQLLKSYQTSTADPVEPDITIYDGFYLLHTFTRIPERYGAISKHILQFLLFGKKRAHIIFDKYNFPNIKDYEHTLREEDTENQYIIQRENKRSADFAKLLRSRNFKEKFVEFLIEDWTNDEYTILCENKTIKLDYGNNCYVFEVVNNHIKRTIDYNLSSMHEEADTKIVHHIHQLNADYRVNVKCTDSDIPTIILANMKYLKCDIQIVVDMSTSKKKEYFYINEIWEKVGEKLSIALAVCHIFTGNDYNPSFYRKGKKKPFKLLKAHTKFQDAFVQLLKISPSNMTLQNPVFLAIEEFVCRMYNLKAIDVNLGRLELFDKAFSHTKQSEEVCKKKIKGLDASSMPPTKEELLQQIKRTIYISSIWCNAHLRSPTTFVPEDCGWTLIDNQYHYYWFDGSQSPTFEDITNKEGMH